MFNPFRRKAGGGYSAGIGFHADGVSVALLRRNPSDPAPQLAHCAFLPAADPVQQTASLKQAAAANRLACDRLSLVLEPGSYTLFQVEAPEVEPDELRSAIRWRIKDMIDFHIDDAVIDLFDLPESRRPGMQRMMNVVVARSSMIQQRVDQLEAAGLPVGAIDITELALRNLQRHSDSSQAVATVYLFRRFGLIQVMRDGLVYLSRRIDITSEDLEAAQGDGPDFADALVLEIQRSLDYFESQFALGSAAAVQVVATSSAMESFALYAGDNLLAPVSAVTPMHLLDGMGQSADADLAHCLPAIGAALREDLWVS